MYRVLCFGDPHFRKNYKEDSDLMRAAFLAKARELRPDRIVVMGDLTHDHKTVDLTVLNDATNLIYDLSEIAETEVLIGNHDLRNNSEYFSDCHPFSGVRYQARLRIVWRRVDDYVPVLGRRFVFVPYVPEGRFGEACPPECYSAGDVAAIFCHQTFQGARYRGQEVSKTADHWPATAPLVVSGHIHDHQWLAPNLLYVGSPMQHDFGDRSEKSISLLTFVRTDTRVTYREERIRIGLRERQELTLMVETIYDWVPGPHRYKVYVSGTTAQVRLFFTSAKHRALLAAGVIMLEGELTDVEPLPDSPVAVTDLRPSDYLADVRRAIGDRPRILKWFDLISAE